MDTTPSRAIIAGHDHPATPRVRVGSPADLLAIVPYLLGFHPARSFVVIGARGPRGQVDLGFRYDLPEPPCPGQAAEIAGHAVATLTGRGVTTVIGVGYGPGALVTPVADVFAAGVTDAGMRLRELLRADGGRYWSYLCRDLRCCPADGVGYDSGSHRASAVMTAAGYVARPSRETLASTLAPVTGPAAAAMTAALARAQDKATSLIPRAPARPGGREPLITAGRRAVRDAIAVYRRGRTITRPDQLAWLLVTLARRPVRDDAWARMLPAHRDAHLALWLDLTRRAQGRWLPAPAALAAYTAWQGGDGALANLALDLALGADPGYTMALLLRDVLHAGLAPSEARPPMPGVPLLDSVSPRPGPGRQREGGASGKR